EGEVLSLGLLRPDGDRCCLFCALVTLLVPGNERVVARRQALDRERAIFRGDREEGVVEHAYVGLHPVVLVALHRNESLCLAELFLDGYAFWRLRLIPLRVLGR